MRRPFLLLAIVGLVLAAAVFAILASKWPFTQARVAESLGGWTQTQVQFEQYRLTFFPHPGAVAERAVFLRQLNEQAVKLAHVERLHLRGSWFTLLTFRRRLAEMRAEGLHIALPKQMPPPVQRASKGGSETTITEFVGDGAVLELGSGEGGGSPLRFEFPRLSLHELAKSKQIQFHTMLKTPHPPAELNASGALGPWREDAPGLTPVSGSAELINGDLSRYRGIAGSLSARASWRGTLGRVEVRGQADSPNFEVNRNGHATPLRAEYDALVNALSGDVALKLAEAQFRNTHLSVSGNIANAPGQPGKTVTLDFEGKQARIQDLLLMFTRARPPALSGPMTLRAHVVLPPGEGEFLRKLRLTGDFRIDNAHFKQATQRKVNDMSARALGGGDEMAAGVIPDGVVSDLRGHVQLRGGTANLSNISFVVPGARANGAGTYNLLSKRVDLHGSVAMESDVSDATSGIKSVLLKPFDWAFKRKKSGTVLPVSVIGKYPTAKFSVSLRKK